MNFKNSKWIEIAGVIFYIYLVLLSISVIIVSIVYSIEESFLFGKFLLFLLVGLAGVGLYFILGMLLLNFLYNVAVLKYDVEIIKNNLDKPSISKKIKEEDTVFTRTLLTGSGKSLKTQIPKQKSNAVQISSWFCEKCGQENGAQTDRCKNCFTKKPDE